jgi:hypothetical protein
MNAKSFERHLSHKGSDPDQLARAAARSPALLQQVVDGLLSETATVRFNSSKVLLVAARETPACLERQIPAILKMLDSENKFLKSAAIRTLGLLAVVDKRGRITRALDKILEPIPGPDLVVAVNAMEGAGLIAEAKPRVTDRVVPRLLSVARGQFKTTECRNIAMGRAIDALAPLYPASARKTAIEKFVRGLRNNNRKATRDRVERFLRQTATTC